MVAIVADRSPVVFLSGLGALIDLQTGKLWIPGPKAKNAAKGEITATDWAEVAVATMAVAKPAATSGFKNLIP